MRERKRGGGGGGGGEARRGGESRQGKTAISLQFQAQSNDQVAGGETKKQKPNLPFSPCSCTCVVQSVEFKM